MEEGHVGDDEFCKYVDKVMEKSWKDYRYELHQYFKRFRSTENARQHPYGNVTQDDWDWLCTFFENKYSERRPKKDPATRAQLPYNHRAWSKSSLCHGDDEVELFHDTHHHAMLQDHQERLRRLEERVFGDKDSVAQEREGIVLNQQERLRLLEEQVFDRLEGNVADPGLSS